MKQRLDLASDQEADVDSIMIAWFIRIFCHYI